jgi:hypothetical protein
MALFKNILERVLRASFGEYTEFRGMFTTVGIPDKHPVTLVLTSKKYVYTIGL